MKTIATFNALHLGDNIVHLHFLRALAKKYPEIHFLHGCQGHYLAQIGEMLDIGVPNLEIRNIDFLGQGAINAWRGAGNHWYQHPQRNDFVTYHLDWFRHLAKQMGLESPFTHARDFLFDYPALKQETGDRIQESGEFDFLIIDSPPQSGQWSGFSMEAFDNLVGSLVIAGKTVVTSRPHRMSVTAIGRLAQSAKCIVGCVTGPMWVTQNVWNADSVKLRVHLLDQERVDYLPNTTVHCNNLSLVPEILKDRGLL